jgi:hypothetical protein
MRIYEPAVLRSALIGGDTIGVMVTTTSDN